MSEIHPVLLIFLSITGLLVLYYVLFGKNSIFRKQDSEKQL